MKLFGKEIKFNGFKIYHAGDKPTPSEIGAAASGHGHSNASKTAPGYCPQLPNESTTKKYLRQDGTWAVPPDTNTTYSNMTGAAASAAGKAGLVPAPPAGAQGKYLKGDGTWNTPYTHPTSAGNKHIPAGGASGQILGWSAAGTAKWVDPGTSGTQVLTQGSQPSGHVAGRVWVKTY